MKERCCASSWTTWDRVEASIRDFFQPRRGASLAQGNALGGRDGIPSALIGRKSRYPSALSGLGSGAVVYPGRCPRLSACAPSGLMEELVAPGSRSMGVVPQGGSDRLGLALPLAVARPHVELQQPARDLAVEERHLLGGLDADIPSQVGVAGEDPPGPAGTVVAEDFAQRAVERP